VGVRHKTGGPSRVDRESASEIQYGTERGGAVPPREPVVN